MARPKNPPKPMKPIAVGAAKAIAERYGYDQVVIYGRRVGDLLTPHGEHMTTYGVNKRHCEVAAMMGVTLREFMGWHTDINAAASDD